MGSKINYETLAPGLFLRELPDQFSRGGGPTLNASCAATQAEVPTERKGDSEPGPSFCFLTEDTT